MATTEGDQHGPVDEAGLPAEEQVARALCRQNKLPFVDLAKVKLPEALVGLLDQRVVEEYDVVPVKKQGNQIIQPVIQPVWFENISSYNG